MQDDIEADVRRLADARDPFAEDEASLTLRRYGDAVAAYLAAEYDHSTTATARAKLVHHSIRFARRRPESYRLGLHALDDLSGKVRHEACGLLSYAQRPEAMPALEALLSHKDPDTRDDAIAALVAIGTGNHHYYRDRHRTDRVFWVVNPEDEPEAEKPDQPDTIDRLTRLLLIPAFWLRRKPHRGQPAD